jgi:hypothetical protein
MIGAGQQFGVELAGHEEGMVAELDEFGGLAGLCNGLASFHVGWTNKRGLQMVSGSKLP